MTLTTRHMLLVIPALYVLGALTWPDDWVRLACWRVEDWGTMMMVNFEGRSES